MKYNFCSTNEKPIKKKFAKLEADVFKALGRKPSKMRHKDDGTQTYVACNPTLRMGEAADAAVVDNMMSRLVDSLAKELAASAPDRISAMEVMPAHEPRKLRMGWVVTFRIESADPKHGSSRSYPATKLSKNGETPNWRAGR